MHKTHSACALKYVKETHTHTHSLHVHLHMHTHAHAHKHTRALCTWGFRWPPASPAHPPRSATLPPPLPRSAQTRVHAGPLPEGWCSVPGTAAVAAAAGLVAAAVATPAAGDAAPPATRPPAPAL